MEKTNERNRYRWVPIVDHVTQLEEERRQLEEEERHLDRWIWQRTVSVQAMKKNYIEGIERVHKRARTMTTETKKREDTAAVNNAHVTPPPVEPIPNAVTPATTEPATKAWATIPPTPAATPPPILSKHAGKVHCLATLAQRFQQVIAVREDVSTS